jgi:hypothetical protein
MKAENKKLIFGFIKEAKDNGILLRNGDDCTISFIYYNR